MAFLRLIPMKTESFQSPMAQPTLMSSNPNSNAKSQSILKDLDPATARLEAGRAPASKVLPLVGGSALVLALLGLGWVAFPNVFSAKTPAMTGTPNSDSSGQKPVKVSGEVLSPTVSTRTPESQNAATTPPVSPEESKSAIIRESARDPVTTASSQERSATASDAVVSGALGNEKPSVDERRQAKSDSQNTLAPGRPVVSEGSERKKPEKQAAPTVTKGRETTAKSIGMTDKKAAERDIDIITAIVK
jgi:hypothetical protein